MKTTNSKVLLATVAVSALALIAITKATASLLPVAVAAVGYTVATVIFALAAMDYRVGPKDYSAR